MDQFLCIDLNIIKTGNLIVKIRFVVVYFKLLLLFSNSDNVTLDNLNQITKQYTGNGYTNRRSTVYIFTNIKTCKPIIKICIGHPELIRITWRQKC